MQLTFGERNWVVFSSESDFFKSLGYLCNNKRGIYISSESSTNRWGAELRIWLTNVDNMPKALSDADSEGVGTYLRRINCNEYVYYLVNNFGFKIGTYQSSSDIRNIVSTKYPSSLSDFDYGYNL